MSFPLVLSYHGDVFARVNPDRSWTVDWTQADKLKDEPVTLSNLVVTTIASMLIAAKDKLSLTSWVDSDAAGEDWPHSQKTWDTQDAESLQYNPLYITYQGEQVAELDTDGKWTVRWEMVKSTSQCEDSWRHSALAAFCQLMLHAKDSMNIAAEKEEDAKVE